MRTLALVRKSLVLIASLAALSVLGASDVAATGTTIAPTPTPIWVIQGSWFNSNTTLSAAIDSSQTSFTVQDTYVIIEGMLLRVDQETMLVTDFIDGVVYNTPDTVVVERAQEGTTAVSHDAGAGVRTQAVNVDIRANDITDPEGLQSFEVRMVLPPEVQYVVMYADTTWLASTGREVSCGEPQFISGAWALTCVTLGLDPNGPTGSGVIARLTVLPRQDVVKVNNISFAGSSLRNTLGQEIPATVQNLAIRVMACPDANLDGWVNSGDNGEVARNFGDTGEDTGSTLLADINASQTNNIAISDQSALVIGDTISINREQMTVSALHEGSPDTMSVVRPVNGSTAVSHNAETHIFRGIADNNHDGKKGYTDPRDVNDDNGINSGDRAAIARVFQTQCPGP